MLKKVLKPYGIDAGFCRVYYKHERDIYCLQDDGYANCVNMQFYSCSKDGEPSHLVNASGFEFPILPEDSKLATDANAFVRAL